VRAKIKPKTERLIDDGPRHGNQGYNRNGQLPEGYSLKHKANSFDPFRNFKEEAEDVIGGDGDGGGAAAGGAAGGGVPKGDNPKLSKIFALPKGLIEPLNWDAAKMKGTDYGKFLLVNIQKMDEFACHVLNRDIWNHAEVRTVLGSQFLFWQRQHNSRDGEEYVDLSSFYDEFVLLLEVVITVHSYRVIRVGRTLSFVVV
jgi:hypothetical protein